MLNDSHDVENVSTEQAHRHLKFERKLVKSIRNSRNETVEWCLSVGADPFRELTAQRRKTDRPARTISAIGLAVTRKDISLLARFFEYREAHSSFGRKALLGTIEANWLQGYLWLESAGANLDASDIPSSLIKCAEHTTYCYDDEQPEIEFVNKDKTLQAEQIFSQLIRSNDTQMEIEMPFHDLALLFSKVALSGSSHLASFMMNLPHTENWNIARKMALFSLLRGQGRRVQAIMFPAMLLDNDFLCPGLHPRDQFGERLRQQYNDLSWRGSEALGRIKRLALERQELESASTPNSLIEGQQFEINLDSPYVLDELQKHDSPKTNSNQSSGRRL